MKSIGKTLKEARSLNVLTLRQVEELTGISNAYLSQLENDKIKKPSANVLYKLASLYKQDLNSLLSAAGIIEKGQSVSKSANYIKLPGHTISKEEESALLDYLKYLRYSKRNQ
jgi:HTH-type transcriptional regulator, competence development regulator